MGYSAYAVLVLGYEIPLTRIAVQRDVITCSQRHPRPTDETPRHVYQDPLLYRGPFDKVLLQNLHQEERGKKEDGSSQACEGFVVRTADGFPYSAFRRRVAKYVREGHVQTQAHWTRNIRPNGVAS